MIAPGKETDWHDSDYKASVFSIFFIYFSIC